MSTTRHEYGTDYERALADFPTHKELPANRRSAAEAIERHAAHRATSVADVAWIEYDDDRIQPIDVHFEDGSRCTVYWGFVYHFDTDVPGADGGPEHFSTWLPENRRRSESIADRIEATHAQCECAPGLQQPVGSSCMYCAEPIAADTGTLLEDHLEPADTHGSNLVDERWRWVADAAGVDAKLHETTGVVHLRGCTQFNSNTALRPIEPSDEIAKRCSHCLQRDN